ncbi:MAG: hypothetical protein KatS3mg057_1490 [Herpetosiphonaceae bacterium]|nr:MAG: hypothetical protein KatS3mg057_1490 [Herpetosiphonaceae bacterium]
MTRRTMIPYLVLFFGVLVVSTASVLIKSAHDHNVPSLVIAAGRLGLAALILTPIAWSSRGAEIRSASRRDLGIGILAGLFLGLHFAAWITSLNYTSVASSTALVATNPIFVGLASYLLFRERLPLSAIGGIILTVLGSILIAFSDSGAGGSNALLGDLLALAGAACGSAYFLAGREVRRRLSILPYIWLAYTSAAVMLVAWALLAGYRLTGYDTTISLVLLGLAIGPQLLGHTAFNWALRYLSATFITIAILGEPVGSTLLAIAIRGEQPTAMQIAGGGVVLLGITIATLAERQRAGVAPRAEAEAVVAQQAHRY